MTGSRYLSLTEFYLDVTENWKTAKVSLYDTLFNDGNLLPESSDWTYDDDYEVEFEDPYAYFNLLVDVLKIIDGTGNVYGYHEYYTKTLF